MNATLNIALEKHRSNDNAVLDTILVNINEFEKSYNNLTKITDTILSLVYDTEEVENIVEYTDVDIYTNDSTYITKESLKQEYGQRINEIYMDKFLNKETKLNDRLNCYTNKIYIMDKKHDENILSTLNKILNEISINLIDSNKKFLSVLKEDKVLFDSCKKCLLRILFEDSEFGLKRNIDDLLVNTTEYKDNLISLIDTEMSNKNMSNIIMLLNKMKTIDLKEFNSLRMRFIEVFQKPVPEPSTGDDTNVLIDGMYEMYKINVYNKTLKDLV